VTLDGGGSSGDAALTYQWTAPTGITLTNPATATPTFPAPAVTQETTLTFSLTVTDSAGNTATDEVAIAVTPLTLTLAIVAGNDTINIAEQTAGFTLSGTVEDGATLTVTVGSATLTPAIAGTTWTAAVLPNARYITGTSVQVSLSASQGSATQTVTRDLTVDLTAPIANAGTDQIVAEGTTVTLDGGGSSGDPALTYQWTAPAGVTLTNSATATPTFAAPAVTQEATLTFSLTVTDRAGNSSTPDEVAIAISPLTLTLAPVATDNTVNIAEKAAGFTLSGTVEQDATLTVTVGSQTLTPTIAGTNWTATVLPNAPYITGTTLDVALAATLGAAEQTLSRQLTVDLTAPTATYTPPTNLTVGVAITPISPTSTGVPSTGAYALKTGR